MYFSVVLYLLAIVGSPGCWFTSLAAVMSGCLQRMDDCCLLVDCVIVFVLLLAACYAFFLLHLSYVFFQTLCLNFSFKEFKELVCISSTENICSLCSKARQCTSDFVCFRFFYCFYYYCCCVYIFFILLYFLCLNFFLFTF